MRRRLLGISALLSLLLGVAVGCTWFYLSRTGIVMDVLGGRDLSHARYYVGLNPDGLQAGISRRPYGPVHRSPQKYWPDSMSYWGILGLEAWHPVFVDDEVTTPVKPFLSVYSVSVPYWQPLAAASVLPLLWCRKRLTRHRPQLPATLAQRMGRRLLSVSAVSSLVLLLALAGGWLYISCSNDKPTWLTPVSLGRSPVDPYSFSLGLDRLSPAVTWETASSADSVHPSYDWGPDWCHLYVHGFVYGRTTYTIRVSYGMALTLSLLVGTVSSTLWLRAWRRDRRARLRLASGLCIKCGYDMRATPDRCPECGRSVAARI